MLSFKKFLIETSELNNTSSIDSYNKILRTITKLNKNFKIKTGKNLPEYTEFVNKATEIQQNSKNKSLFYATPEQIKPLLVLGTGIIRKLTNTTNQDI